MALAACAVLLLALPCPAEEEEETLTGDWFGLRGDLEAEGVSVSGFLLDDFTRIQRGGLDPHSGANRYWLEVRADFDLHRIGLPEGGRLSAAYWQLGGENGSEDVPAFQTISVYESEFRRELGELFLEQPFGGAWRMKAGKMDANYDFAYTDHGNDFQNLGVSFPPNLLGIPTIPDPAVGGALFHEPEEGPYAGLGVFDGALQDGVPTGRRGASTLFGPPPDMYGILEAGWAGECGGNAWRLGLGAWRHTGDFPEYGGGISDGTAGWYGILEGRLWRSGEAEDDERGLYAILRFTAADERVNPIERHGVAAMVWKGPIPSREEDSLGAAWMVADLTDDAAAGMRSPTEQVLEAYYRIRVTPWFSVMPDVQFVANGGGGVGDALVLGARVVVDF